MLDQEPTRKEFLVFGRPTIGDSEIAEVVETLRSGWIGMGPRVKRFEEAFRAYIGAEHAIALSSASAALHVSLVASGIGPGAEVITTPMTFCATAHAIVHAGARPVFVDVEKSTGNIDPDQIEAAITRRTKAILPVHYAGRPCQMDRIEATARRQGLTLIEDAAHALEAAFQGRKVGTIGDCSCFSFYATKNVTAAEGGMVTTQDADLAAKMRVYALHGMTKDAWARFSHGGDQHYEVVAPGFKYNMTDLQAALGIHQLARVPEGVKRRQEIWTCYDEAFASLPVDRPAPIEPETIHARHLYTILIEPKACGKTRDEVAHELAGLNIGTGVHYRPLHLEPYYRDTYGYRRGMFPNAELIGDRTLSLPFSAGLSHDDVTDVIRAVRRLCGA
jgi:dTDP-4-amino-4,6-dideoxygalactose transaminase